MYMVSCVSSPAVWYFAVTLSPGVADLDTVYCENKFWGNEVLRVCVSSLSWSGRRKRPAVCRGRSWWAAGQPGSGERRAEIRRWETQEGLGSLTGGGGRGEGVFFISLSVLSSPWLQESTSWWTTPAPLTWLERWTRPWRKWTSCWASTWEERTWRESRFIRFMLHYYRSSLTPCFV